MFIWVDISRFGNGDTKPRLFSNLVLDCDENPFSKSAFKLDIDPLRPKHEIVKSCSGVDIPRFDQDKEVNAMLCLSSILAGWVYRHLSGEYSTNETTTFGIIIRNIAKLLTVEEVVKKEPEPVDTDGWTEVSSKRKKKPKKSAFDYMMRVSHKIVVKNDWSGIFDVNCTLVPMAIASRNVKLIKKIDERFKIRMSKMEGEQLEKESRKYKIFLWMIN